MFFPFGYFPPHPPTPGYRWTGAHKRLFLELLGSSGSVARAARAVGKSRKSAHQLRRRDPLFDACWDAVILMARAVCVDLVMAEVCEPRFHVMERDAGTGRMQWHRPATFLTRGNGFALLVRLNRECARIDADPVRRDRADHARVAIEPYLDRFAPPPVRPEDGEEEGGMAYAAPFPDFRAVRGRTDPPRPPSFAG